MNKKRGLWSIIMFLLLLSVGSYFYFGSVNKEKRILIEGIEVTAIVYKHYKSTSFRGDKIWISLATYIIDKKEYNYVIEAKVPVGKSFILKYLPEIPENPLLINPDEFKEYPRSYKKNE